MTLEEILALFPDNTSGDIDADDMRSMVTELWNYTLAVQAALNTVAVESGNQINALDARLDTNDTADAAQNTAITDLDGRVDTLESASPEAGGPIQQDRVDADTQPRWTTTFTGTLTADDENVAEHWTNAELRAGLNEWGAFRAWSAPYPDAAFRAVRENTSDEGTGGTAPCFHINDRRSGAVSPHTWARLWNGGLQRNGINMTDVYVTDEADPTADPNFANLPDGTLIVSTAE